MMRSSCAESLWGDTVLANSFRGLLAVEILQTPLPQVPRIDCFHCRKVDEQMTTPHVKCCDVIPVLANFLVGEILSAGTQPVIEAWIVQRRGDPYAIWVPPDESARHLSARKEGRYGLPCPLLSPEQGTCSVYAHRPALCVGYHCYYPDRLWQEAWACFTSTLELWQDAASRYLVTLFAFDLQRVAAFWQQEPAPLWHNQQQVEEFYEACWQHWRGKEREFYIECYKKLCALEPQQHAAIRDLHRQYQMDRLEQQGQIPDAQFKALADEFVHRDALRLSPQPPDAKMRKRWQRGAIPAEDNPFSLHQQESIMLWYALQIQQAQKPAWWKTLWRGRREVQADLPTLQDRSQGHVEKTDLEHEQKRER